MLGSDPITFGLDQRGSCTSTPAAAPKTLKNQSIIDPAPQPGATPPSTGCTRVTEEELCSLKYLVTRCEMKTPCGHLKDCLKDFAFGFVCPSWPSVDGSGVSPSLLKQGQTSLHRLKFSFAPLQHLNCHFQLKYCSLFLLTYVEIRER